MLDQQKLKSVDSLGRMISEEEKPTAPESELCELHPGEKLLYYCENDTCRRDVCQTCWGSDHDGHNVKLLSKKVSCRGVVSELHT